MAFSDRTWRWIIKEALGSAHSKNEKDVLKISAGYTNKGIMLATASTTAVVNAAATSPTGATTVTTGITNPDVSRNLTVLGSTSTAAGFVTVTGRNVEGKVISETFALNGTSTVTGNMAFKSVTSVAIPTQVGVGITVSVGTGNKLGLHHRLEPGVYNIRCVTDTDMTSIDSHVFDAQPTVTTSDFIELNTATPVTLPDGAHFYRFYYIIYFWSLDNQEGKEQYTTTTSTSSTSSSTSTTTLTTSTSVSSTSVSSTSSSTSSTSTSHSTSSTSTSTSTLP